MTTALSVGHLCLLLFQGCVLLVFESFCPGLEAQKTQGGRTLELVGKKSCFPSLPATGLKVLIRVAPGIAENKTPLLDRKPIRSEGCSQGHRLDHLLCHQECSVV